MVEVTNDQNDEEDGKINLQEDDKINLIDGDKIEGDVDEGGGYENDDADLQGANYQQIEDEVISGSENEATEPLHFETVMTTNHNIENDAYLRKEESQQVCTKNTTNAVPMDLIASKGRKGVQSSQKSEDVVNQIMNPMKASKSKGNQNNEGTCTHAFILLFPYTISH